MDPLKTTIPEKISSLIKNDRFSQWLGIEMLECAAGSCSIKMTIREEMCNGFGIAHGGIAYSFADSALAFASNNHDQPCVSIETSISHIRPLNIGDRIIARAAELSRGKSTGLYQVRVENDKGVLVALFKGTVFIKK